MNSREAMARRYCIIRREDPDEIFEGEPVWKHGARDIDAMLLMLDSFGVKDPLSERFSARKEEQQIPMDFGSNLSRVIKLSVF